MKKLTLLLVLCLMLTACSAKVSHTESLEPSEEDVLQTLPPEETESVNLPTQELPPAIHVLPEESSAWADYAEYGDKLGIILNEPVENPPRYTTLWMEGEYECGYIIPRYVGSYVNLFEVEWSEDFSTYTIGDVPVYSTEVGDGCVIYSVLPRPEGFPTYYIEIVLPDGRGNGWILQYDGRDGTAPVEFFEIGK